VDSHGSRHGLEDLVFECLERIDADGESALEAVCREHPSRAQQLRDRVALLRRMGLHGAPDGAPAMPDRLGDFRLVERLGTGGMGVVYLAEQVSLGRSVALKLIRPEQLYFAHARERFRREIEAIALLQHASIVPIHATGEENGIPYYAMEYVRGASLAQVLAAFSGRDPSKLTGRDLRDLIVAAAPSGADPAGDLFVGSWSEVSAKIARALALAVQHAHERGVLHRDIKPSNVMIAADGRVVLLDFGLASLGSNSALTRTGSQIGSLPYMAPEQLRAQIDRIGARTDVYGIGVTLYELLALAPAFSDPGDTEVLRERILAAQPRPLRSLHAGLGSDLALVCSTAMQPEPGERYASAALLAADLANVLALRPIAARAPSPAARVVGWARRNPARATATALAAALVIGGPLVFGLQQIAANRRIAAINQDLARALGESELQRTRADRERAASERNLHKAVAAVDTMLTRVGQETLRDVPQMVTVRRDLLEDALRFYSDFLDERQGDPDLRRAVQLSQSRVSAMRVMLGDLTDAEGELETLVDELRARAESPDAEDETLSTFADLMGRLGEVNSWRGNFDASESRISEAITVFERIPAPRRTADIELRRGAAYDKLAELERRRGRTAEAEAAARAAVAISREGLVRFPARTEFVLALGHQLDRLGTILLRSRREVESIDVLSEAARKLQDYRESEPGDVHGREKLASASINLANAFDALQRADEARASSERALELDEGLVRDFPDVPAYRTDLAVVHLQLFGHDYRAARLDEAEVHVRRALELQESVADQFAKDSTFLAEVSGTLNSLAALQIERGQDVESLATTDRGLAYLERALAMAPDNGQWLHARRVMRNNAAMTLVALGRWREAVDSAEKIDPVDDARWHSRRAGFFERAARIAARDESLEASERSRASQELCERALAELTRAVELGQTDWSVLDDPDELTSLRTDPRFEALVARSTQPK
jgi:serine/threonine protein kinase